MKCVSCGESKSLNCFYRRGAGYRKQCKHCIIKRQKKHLTTKQSIEVTIKVCSECELEKNIKDFSVEIRNLDGHNGKCKECVKGKKLKWKFGITKKQYDDMLREQSYRCAICQCQQSENSKSSKCETIKNFAVDHCHKTGRVRRLLCDPCNHAESRLPNVDAIIRHLLYRLDYTENYDATKTETLERLMKEISLHRQPSQFRIVPDLERALAA